MDTYPGTDMLKRICYSADCQKLIERLCDVWVDVDSNCCICTQCRNRSLEVDYHGDIDLWSVEIVPAEYIGVDIINEMQEGVMLERDQLKADRMYRLFHKDDESDESWFYTPDGVGGFWYDSEDEMLEELGYKAGDGYRFNIISAQIPSWF